MNKRTKIIVAAMIAVAVIAVSCIGVLYSRYMTAWKNYENQHAQTHKQYSVVQENSKKLETMIGDEETFLAQTNNADLYQESTELLDKAQSATVTEKIQQPQGFITQLRATKTIHDATKKSEEQNKTFVSLNSDIEAAIKKIEAAFLDKAVADYTTALDEQKNIIESLATLISDTDGKVLDDAIRQEASATLADAQKTVEETVDTKNLEAVKKATTNLTQQLAILKEKISALTESNHAYEQQQQQSRDNYTAPNNSAYNNNTSNWNTSNDSILAKNEYGDNSRFNIPQFDRTQPIKEGFIPYG